MDLEAVSNGNMSNKKAPKGVFHSPAGGFFSQRKKAFIGNVKHSGDEKDIFLKSGSGASIYSDVESLSGDNEDIMNTGMNFSSPNFEIYEQVKSLPPPLKKKIPLDRIWIDHKIIKTPVKMSVKKSFALDINFLAVEEKSAMQKTQFIRNFFSKSNGFGGATTLSKFKEIIQSTFTSEESIEKAALLARENGIIVNTDLKKQEMCSDRAIVIKEILMDIPKEIIVTAVFTFGKIKSIKIQLIGMWQKTMVEFAKLGQADLLALKWSFLIRKNSVHMAKAMGDRDTWASKDRFRVLLFTLLMRTTVHNLGTLLNGTSGKTCIINQSFETGNRVHCAVVGFESKRDLDSAFHTEPIFGDAPAPKPSLYAKKNVSISHPAAFGGKSWAQVVSDVSSSGHPLFDSGLGSGSFPFGAFGLGGAALLSSVNNFFLGERLASLECSLGLLVDQVSGIVKRLSFVELVLLVPSSLGSLIAAIAFKNLMLNSDMILDGTSVSGASHLSFVVDGMHNFSSSSFKVLTSKVGGLKTKLASLEASIGSVLASVGLWIANKFEGVQVFASGLEKGFLGVGVAVIVNNFLAHHVFKVEEISSQLILVQLLFKGKLSVTFLGLYAGALAEAHFYQAVEVNSLIAKAVNSSTFVILGGDFNENGSGRSASFRFCLKLGLVNVFTNYHLKTIDYVFVSGTLASALAGHQVKSVSEFFDTNHNAVLVSVGLGGLLDIQLNSLCKQANKNQWKFKIKDADGPKWARFKDHSFAMLLVAMGKFFSALALENVNAAWSILEEIMVASADEIFLRCWFSKFQCFRNKHSSRFFGLELLVVKIGRCFHSRDMSGVERFVRKWSTLDDTRAHIFADLCGSGVKSEGGIIRSVLDQPFCKVVLDYLVVDEELVLEPGDMKLKVDEIMERWTRKRGVLPVLLDLWACQYAPLDYVRDDAFLGVMCVINKDELLSVVMGLPDGKTAGLSGIPNKAWISMIPKSYNWDGVLMNTRPIALIKTARKILSKILLDQILATCSKFGVLYEDNFSVLKGTSTQSSVFAVGSVIEDVLEKNRELWLVLQNMRKTYDSVGWHYLEASLKIKNVGGLTSFFAAGAFVDDTIWIENCQASTQYALNIASEFFSINNISINNEKTVAIPINQGVQVASLNISSQPIFIAEKGETHCYLGIFLSTDGLSKPSLTKAYFDIRFFVNVMLRKAVIDKQFSYLSLKIKACLPCDFPDAALHYLLLYGLKPFEQLQSKSKLAAVVFFSNAFGILGHLFNHRFLDLQVLGWASLNPLQFSVKLHKRLDPRRPVPFWFSLTSEFLVGGGILPSGFSRSVGCSGSDIFDSEEFFGVWDCLHKLWSGSFEVFMDGLLVNTGSGNVMGGAATYFSSVDLSIGVGVSGLLSSTLAKLEKDLSVSWVKVKRHSGVYDNIKANSAAGAVTYSRFFMSVRVQERFLKADSMVLSGNACYFARDLHKSVCRARWEAGSGCDVILGKLVGCVNWVATLKVWHFDSYMLAGFTSQKSSGLQSYLMKAVHRRLSVAIQKKLYNKEYPGVLCLLCDKVELPNHVFSCILDASIWEEILAEASALWVSLLGPCFLTPATLMFLDNCSSDIGLYSVLCKDFVMSDWCLKAIGAFKNKKKAAGVVIDFVRGVVKLHRTKIWLIRTKHRTDMERTGLVRNGGLVSGLFCCVASALSDSVIRLLGILESFAVSFGHHRACLFFSGLNFNPQVVISV
ncbi:hypothetical protein G9A89_011297 [Geosiphon pyriformis]|nr:hypothetical protein G9A89_011297 [Geosiphon pyriformis]